MHSKLRYVSKRNKLAQLVVQVKYHVNVIYSLGGGHTHTHRHAYRRCGQKQFQETRHAPGLNMTSPGLNPLAFLMMATFSTWMSSMCQKTVATAYWKLRENLLMELLFYYCYLLYQLGTVGQAQPIQGTYP